MKVVIGSDHAGYELKEKIKRLLKEDELEFFDAGTNNSDSVDYPDYAEKVAEAVAEGKFDRGIVVCGSGIGVAMAANKIPGIRAAVCNDLEAARLSREHNDANILAIGERLVDIDKVEEIVRVWLETKFAGGRHLKRLSKIVKLEKKYSSRKRGKHNEKLR
ncbi:MAG TPA: ribose 5-phosphate isomerase B [Actinobacteria bacterium]|nr:ribose 5-phosphate isomerase B [Actinomycetota bacterium]